MIKKSLFILVILALGLAACASQKGASTQSPALSYDSVGEGGAPSSGIVAPSPAKSSDAFNSTTTSAGIAAAQERLIQTNVTISIVVPDVQKKIDEINKLASSLGGYLVSMNINQVSYGDGDMAPQGAISIRVPSVKLEDALTQIKANTVDVPAENRTGQDVTSQYIDLQSQLKNLQQAEADLQAIMDEAKNTSGNDATTKTQDVLNVYSQIVSIRGQIEQIQGQMKYIEETTSTSSISVTLVAEATVQPIKIGHWQPKGTANQAIQSLIKFLQGFVDFLIWFVLLALPAIIVIFGPLALIIWGIIALVKRRRKARLVKSA